MKPKHKRLTIIITGLLIGGIIAAVILYNFRSNLVFFYSPSELVAQHVGDRVVRIGGLVEKGSIQRDAGGLDMQFTVTDGKQSVKVKYHGLPPALFREGQGMVAHGRLNAEGVFIADQIMAKHDEKYMPPEVARALKKTGRWKEGEGQE